MIRIVKMEFEPEKVQEFLNYFEKVKEHIRQQEGCLHLELLQDIHQNNILFTYSYWKAESYLNQYRDSDFFKEVWTHTKKHFNAQPLAWSVESLHQLP